MDRRERFREMTRHQAKEIALAQLATDGVAGISVNAIAKRMGITGPALYRYFASRDALLTELISDGYHDLADTVVAAIEESKGRGRAARVRAAAAAIRAWAVEAPHRYLLLFGTPVPGYRAPEHTLAAANRTMAAILTTVGTETKRSDRRTALYRQTAAWGERMGLTGLAPGQLHWGLVAWTRVHGVLSLEVTGQFTHSGIDPELLFNAEVESLISWWSD